MLSIVSGHITEDTVWSDTSEAYELDGDLFVDDDVTLTLGDGVSLRSLDASHDIFIDGRLEGSSASIELLRWAYYSGDSSQLVVRNGGELSLVGGGVHGPGRLLVQSEGLAGLSDVEFVYRGYSSANTLKGTPYVVYESDSLGTMDGCTGDWELSLSSDVTLSNSTIGYVNLTGGTPALTGNTFTDAAPLRVTDPDNWNVSGVSGNTFTAEDPVVHVQGGLDVDKTFEVIDGQVSVYQLTDDLTVAAGATLTLGDGATLRSPDAYHDIFIDGRLEGSSASIELLCWGFYDGSYSELLVRNGGELSLVGGGVYGPGRLLVQSEGQADFSGVEFVYRGYSSANTLKGTPYVDYLPGSSGTISNATGDWDLQIAEASVSAADSSILTLTLSSDATVTDSEIGYVNLTVGTPTLTGNTFTDAMPLRTGDPDNWNVSGISGNTFTAEDPVIGISGTLDSDKTFAIVDGLSAYQMTSSLTIAADATLTLGDGVTLIADYYGRYINVDGRLEGINADIELTYNRKAGYRNEFQVHSGGELDLDGGVVRGPGLVIVQEGGIADFSGVEFEHINGGEYYYTGSPKVFYEAGSSGTISNSTGQWGLDISDENPVVHNNDFTNVLVYLSGNPWDTLNLRGNYWGTTDPATIAGMITDHEDDATRPWSDVRGALTVSPLLTDSFYIVDHERYDTFSQAWNDCVEVRFNRAVDAATFTTDDVELVGPNGAYEVTSVEQVSEKVYRINFPPIDRMGIYRLTISSDIADVDGNQLDQNLNGTAGEAEDGYFAEFVCDLTCPSVVRHVPGGDIAGTVEYVDITFSDTIAPRSFEPNDAAATSPSGAAVGVTSVERVTDSIFRIHLDMPGEFGQFEFYVGPDITDDTGNPLDIDGDHTGGEPEDVYVGTFNLVDVDLKVVNLAVTSDTFEVARVMTVAWQGQNTADFELLGDWTDAAYLSQDAAWDIDDILIATLEHTGGLAASQAYSASIDVPIPSVMPGEYYVLVRADLANREKETSEGNNIAVSDALSITIHTLTADANPITDTFTATDRANVYAAHVEVGEALRVVLDADGGRNELYVGYGRIPSRQDYDARIIPNSADTNLIAPGTFNSSNYYIMAYGSSPVEVSYSLSAEGIRLAVIDWTPDEVGNAAETLLSINGYGFSPGMSVELINTGGSSIAADWVTVLSTDSLEATFTEG